MTAPITFYDWPHSPFCMKVRAILDYKRLAYRSVNPLRHMREVRKGGVGKVPAIELDGALLVDSTDIAYALDSRFPDPPVVPTDPSQRARCHVIEDWADESLYFTGLYFRWFDAEGRVPVAKAFGPTLTGRLAYRLYLRRILAQLRGQGTARKSPEHVARDLDRHLDAVGTMLAETPFLLGDRPFLCDFAMWGQLEYLRRTPAGGRALQGHAEIGDYLKRVAATALLADPDQP